MGPEARSLSCPQSLSSGLGGGGTVGKEGWSRGWAEPSTVWGMQAPRAARLLLTPEAKCCPLELKAELKKNKSLKNETFRLNGRYYSKSCSLNSQIDACRTFLFFRVMFWSPNTSDSVPQASDEARHCGVPEADENCVPCSQGQRARGRAWAGCAPAVAGVQGSSGPGVS